MAGAADVIASSSSSGPGVEMESHSKRPFSRDQFTRRSVSGGGDGGGAGLGQTTRSHTLDTIPGLGGQGKSRGRHSRTNSNNNNTNGHIGSYHNNNTTNNSSGSQQHLLNKQHYQHKHSRAVATNANKTNAYGSNNNISQNGTSGMSHVDNGAAEENVSSNAKDATNHLRGSKKFSRRTVSLPKAGSRLFGHVHHSNRHTRNQLSSSTDGNTRHTTSNGINTNNNRDNTNNNGNILISSATTQSHHSIVSNSGNHHSNNNVFPPINADGQVLITRLGTAGEGANDLEGGANSGDLPGDSQAVVTRGKGGVPLPISSPEVPLSRLHFLSEPTFESGHPRTPPIFNLHGMTNGSAGGGVEGGGATANPALRNSALSPDLTGTNQHHGFQRQHQQQPFSPTSGSEKAKGKFEKKLQLSKPSEDSHRSSPQQVTSSPRARAAADNMVGVNNNIPATNQNSPTKSHNKESAPNVKTRQKKDSFTTAKSLPKIAPPEEPFSIRRKIEQFRKWHEEQYVDKMAKFEADASEGLRGVSYGNPHNGMSFGSVDYTKVLEGRIAAGETADDGVKTPKPHFQHFGRGHEQTWIKRQQAAGTTHGGDGDAARRLSVTDVMRDARPTTAATWKTWRDVNTSDVYKDVKKYIQDNDLMDEEREAWIKSWIQDVEKALGGPGSPWSGSEQEVSVVKVIQR